MQIVSACILASLLPRTEAPLDHPVPEPLEDRWAERPAGCPDPGDHMPPGVDLNAAITAIEGVIEQTDDGFRVGYFTSEKYYEAHYRRCSDATEDLIIGARLYGGRRSEPEPPVVENHVVENEDIGEARAPALPPRAPPGLTVSGSFRLRRTPPPEPEWGLFLSVGPGLSADTSHQLRLLTTGKVGVEYGSFRGEWTLSVEKPGRAIDDGSDIPRNSGHPIADDWRLYRFGGRGCVRPSGALDTPQLVMAKKGISIGLPLCLGTSGGYAVSSKSHHVENWFALESGGSLLVRTKLPRLEVGAWTGVDVIAPLYSEYSNLPPFRLRVLLSLGLELKFSRQQAT